MIILDPPAVPTGMDLCSSRHEHQIFEAVLQLLKIEYECLGNSPSATEWLVRDDNKEGAFLIYPKGFKMPVDVRGEADAHEAIEPCETYTGPQGMLDLIFQLRTLAD